MASYMPPAAAESDPVGLAAVAAEAVARAAADLLKQDAATAATDAELVAAVASLGSAISLKQDSATAATDAETAAAIAGVVTLAPATSARNTIVPTAVGAVPLIAKGMVGQTANLLELQDSSGAVMAFVSTGGTTGFANRISAGGGSASLAQLDIAVTTPARVGAVVKAAASQTANLVEFQNSAGTVLSSIGSGGTINALQRMLVGSGTATAAQLDVTSTSASRVGAVVKGAVSQSVNLQEWQDSAGGVLASVSSGGSLSATHRLVAGSGTPTAAQVDTTVTSASRVGLAIRGAASQTANLLELQDSASALMFFCASNGTIAATNRVLAGGGTPAAGQVDALIGSASRVGLAVKGAPSQTANLVELRDSADAVKLSVAPNGALSMGDVSQTTPMLIVSGGSVGNPMIRLIRTGTTFDWALTGGMLSFTDVTNSTLVGGFTGNNGLASLYLGPMANQAPTTRISVLSGATHAAVAGADVAGPALRLQGGLGVGTSAPGPIEFWTGDTALTTVVHPSTVKARMTSVGDLVLLGAGKGVSLKSPDGLTTKKLTIDNAGALALI